MIQRVDAPRDPRLAPFERLREEMRAGPDREERAELHILHRIDLREAVRK